MLPTGSWLTIRPASSTTITGWTADNIEWLNLGNASDGNLNIDMNGNAPGYVEQTFTTLIGATYSVTFDMIGFPHLTGASIRATAAGVSDDFGADPNGNGTYETKTFEFIANSSSTTLRLESLNFQTEGDLEHRGAYMDNVSVIEVSLPSLIVNGSFEESVAGVPLPTDKAWNITGPSNSEIAGWTVKEIDWIFELWESSDGVRNLDMNGWLPGWVEQSFNTIEGAIYSVTFDMAGGLGLPALSIRATAADSSFDFGADPAGNSGYSRAYETKTFEFIATSTSTTLRLASLNNPPNHPARAGGAALDNVNVEFVSFPLPPPPNQSPTSSISSPSDGASFVGGTGVTFTGSATDPEDGSLTGSSLVWTSDKDGSLGTGVSFSTSSLTVNSHLISLVATDSEGAVHTSSITLTVTEPNALPDVSNATVSPAEIWPPNNKMVDITIGGITDSDGDEVTITVTSITDNEGSKPKNVVTGTSPQVRAQRNGKGNGRTYTINYDASDGTDTVQGVLTVFVPHDQGKKGKGLKKESDYDSMPTSFDLAQNYPNPFNPTTNISYEIAMTGFVEVNVYDLTGRLVKNLVQQQQSTGRYSIIWNGTNNFGAKVSSGVYLYQLRVGNVNIVRKMHLIK